MGLQPIPDLDQAKGEEGRLHNCEDRYRWIDSLLCGMNHDAQHRKIARLARQLRKLPHLSEDERWLMARSLAASPDERWRLHETFLRSHGLFSRSERKAFGFS